MVRRIQKKTIFLLFEIHSDRKNVAAGARLGCLCPQSPCRIPSGRGLQGDVSHPDEIVGNQGEGEDAFHLLKPPELDLAHTADGFCPAEDLFDSFSDLLTDLVAGMPGCPCVYGRAFVFLRHMGGGLHDAHGGYKISCVIGLIGPNGDAPLAVVLVF